MHQRPRSRLSVSPLHRHWHRASFWDLLSRAPRCLVFAHQKNKRGDFTSSNRLLVVLFDPSQAVRALHHVTCAGCLRFIHQPGVNGGVPYCELCGPSRRGVTPRTEQVCSEGKKGKWIPDCQTAKSSTHSYTHSEKIP